ncbi:MAG: tetratricopeptide repeat protein [Treponema sp.]|jgi:tetratricopeptide (TPR) repeat protein|nr:tetratricopeptide repeat protein [Treponema sp.]
MKSVLVLAGLSWLLASCAGLGISAEEAFSLGMAYYELGRYEDAERWLNRARSRDKTKSASEYNLGRIAFERGRFTEAAELFEGILEKDPLNIMALKAASYSRIKSGDLKKAEALYGRVLALVPEDADEGYNYALVLYALEKYDEAEEVLGKRQFALLENGDFLLLYARVQAALHKPEAVDSYDKWLMNNQDPKVSYEYAGLLEKLDHYARAIELYRDVINTLPPDSADPPLGDVHFAAARLLLIADGENPEGLEELSAAAGAGFGDREALEDLLADERVNTEGREGIRRILGGLEEAQGVNNAPPQPDQGEGAAEAGAEEAGAP